MTDQVTRDLQNIITLFTRESNLSILINSLYEIVGRPFLVHDTLYKVLAYTRNAQHTVALVKDGYGNFYLNTDTISFIQSERSSRKIEGYDNMYYNPKSGENEGTLLCRITLDTIEIATVAIYENKKPFNADDYTKLELIARLLSFVLQRDNAFEIANQIVPNYILSDILKGKYYDEEHVRHQLSRLEWSHAGAFYLLVIESAHKHAIEARIPQILKQIATWIPLENCMVYEGHIVIFLPEDNFNFFMKEEERNLLDLLELHQLSLGISNFFHDISTSKKHYYQATKAVDIAIRIGRPLLYFSGCTKYILGDLIMTEFSIEEFCHPGVLTLIEYDADKQTDYLKTLKAYLDHIHDPNQAANKLHIHRNTLFYRMGRIKEMTGISLETGKEISQIYYSIALINLQGDYLDEGV